MRDSTVPPYQLAQLTFGQMAVELFNQAVLKEITSFLVKLIYVLIGDRGDFGPKVLQPKKVYFILGSVSHGLNSKEENAIEMILNIWELDVVQIGKCK